MIQSNVHGAPSRRAVSATRPAGLAASASALSTALLLLPAVFASAPAFAETPASQTTAAVPSLGGVGILQTGLGLVFVLALLFGLAWLAKRFGLQRPLGGGNVRIVGSAAVGQRERVVVVEVAGDWIVLGVAPGQVRSLHTIDADRVADLPPSPQAASPGAQANRAAQVFAQKLRESMKKDR